MDKRQSDNPYGTNPHGTNPQGRPRKQRSQDSVILNAPHCTRCGIACDYMYDRNINGVLYHSFECADCDRHILKRHGQRK